LKELLEAKDRDFMGKNAQANELAKLLDSYLEKNRELLAQAAKVNSAAIKAVEVRAQTLEELGRLRAQLAEFEKAQEQV
jgi:precorrin-6B methylase 2